MTQPFIKCILCKYYLEEQRCKAFPIEIPAAIWNNEFDHEQPYPNDKAIQFVAREAALKVGKMG